MRIWLTRGVGCLALLAVASWTAAPAQGRSDWAKTAGTIKSRSGRECREVAEFAVSKGDRAATTDALKAARAWGEDEKKLARVEALLAKLGEGSDGAGRDRVDKVLTGAVSRAEAHMAKPRKTAEDDDVFEGLVGIILTLNGEHPKRRPWLEDLATTASRSRDVARCEALLTRLRTLDPQGDREGAYVALEVVVGQSKPLRMIADDHELVALVLLPAQWSPDKTHPWAVYIDGASSVFEKRAQEMRAIASERGYVLVIPMTLSNANELELGRLPYKDETITSMRSLYDRPQRIAFDMAGLRKLLPKIQQRFRTEDRFGLTGYSGGGFLTYWWLHHHPEDLLAVVPASANYDTPICNTGGISAAPTGAPPVHIMTGATDSAGPPRIFPQSDTAQRALESLGFTVKRTHAEGRGHDPFTREVFDWFDAARGKR